MATKTAITEIVVNRETFVVGERVALMTGSYHDHGCYGTITKINRFGHITVVGPSGYEYSLNKDGHERNKGYYGARMAKAAYLEALLARYKREGEVQSAGWAIQQHVEGWKRGHMTASQIAELRQMICVLEAALVARDAG